MADTEVLFYIIIVIVILVKLVFWCLYLCLKNRRLRRLRTRQANAESREANNSMSYEELPAVPQPAYVFTGLSLPLPYTSLTGSLPEYQADDPFKTDQPPPSYIEIYNEASTSQQELRSFADIDSSDTQRLITEEEP